MKMTFRLTVLVSFVMLAGIYNAVGQCSCAYVTPDSKYVEIIFVGKIMNISEEEKSRKYEINISEIFKGLNDQKTVYAFDSFYNCNESRSLNKEYLFVAARDNTGRIVIVGCSYSYKNKYQQKQMIEILRWKKSSQNQGGIVVGKVVDFVDDEGNSQKPNGVDKVLAESDNGEKYEATIGVDGFYRIENLRKGRYKVFLEMPNTLTTYGDIHDFDNEKSIRYLNLEENEGRIADFSVSINGIISGKVVDSNGKPVSSINVNLLRVEDDEIEEENSVETSHSGEFLFNGLSEGKYLIRVGAEDWYLEPDSLEAIYPTTFYPNKKSLKQAKKIQLNKAQVLNNQNVTLLPMLKKRILKGKVSMPDGQPAVNADVIVQIKRKDNGIIQRSGWHVVTESDSNGDFSLDAYEGIEYLIMFDIDKKLDEVAVEVLYSSSCFVLPEKGRLDPLKITLAKGKTDCDKEKLGF